MSDAVSCPFPSWSSYLPDLAYTSSSRVPDLLPHIETFLKASEHWVSKDKLFEERHFQLHLGELFGDAAHAVALRAAWPELAEEMEEKPEQVCGKFGLARHNMILKEAGGAEQNFPIVRCRPIGREEEVPLRALKSAFFQRLVAVRGTVVRVSTVKPSCTWLSWSCPVCRGEVVVAQPEGRFQPPNRCRPGCRNTKNFTPLRSSRKTICVDRQTIRLQELSDNTLDSGRVPRTLECELTEELCDTLVPGDVARLTGVVKVVTWEEQKRSKGKSQYLLYLSTLSIASPRSRDSRTSSLGISFSQQDYQMVQEVHSYGSGVLKLLVGSLCPSIYGHRLVKAGLLLGLFGGTCRGGESAMPVRGDPHILVVGDPGLGKSQMLNAVVSVAPRGVAVTGNTSTAGGLTVTLTRSGIITLDTDYVLFTFQGGRE